MSTFKKIIFRLIKHTSLVGLCLLFFILLPFVFSLWIDVQGSLKFETPVKFMAMLAVFFMYMSWLVILFKVINQNKKREATGKKIISYLKGQKSKEIRFERLRDDLDLRYSDAFLISVIEAFPEHLSFIRFHNGSKGVSGKNKKEVLSEEFSSA